MAAKIFISYRRDDDPNGAARVRDGLAAKFGKANLFMDVDNLLAGQRFDEELGKALKACDVLIAVIGPRWMDLLKAKSVEGQRDYVREEIGEALKRRIVVIPVLVGRERNLPPLPSTGELPEDLRDLVHYQKHDVVYEHFGRDIAGLIAAIITVRRMGDRPRASRWSWMGLTAAALTAATYVGARYAGAPLPWPAATEAVALKTEEDQRKAREETPRVKAKEAEEQRAAAAKAEEERQRLAMLKVEEDRKRQEADAKRKAEEAARRDPALQVKPGSGQSFRDCPDCPEMVVVPAGTFTMGSPDNEPGRGSGEVQVKVTIARPFAVGRYAVTFDEWDTCVADGGCNGYRPGDLGWGRGKRPVIDVNWDDAKAYAAWLSRKTGKTFRLLSEAEREYVTRAGTPTPFWWGSSITPEQANYNANFVYDGGAEGEYRERTVPVDSFAANPWGLYQVHGNVFEWTADCWNTTNGGNPGDGTARTAGDCTRRVVRGGSWGNFPDYLRSGYRYWDPSDNRVNNVGFRVARTLTP